MEKLLICYISGGLELLGSDKFQLGGLQILQDMNLAKIKPEDDKIKIGCKLLDEGLSMVVADNEIGMDKKIAIAKIVLDTELPGEKFPFLCSDILEKCLIIIIKSVEPEINKRAIEAWDNFFETAACVATASIPSGIVDEIEKVKFLFRQFPKIPKAGLSYLRYCYRSGKLPPEEEWLPGMLEFSETYNGDIDLTTQILACML